MRTKSLLMAVVALILAALACGPPARTPTLEPGVLETAVAETVQAQLAAGEPTATPPPSVTETVPPVITDTPTPPVTLHTPTSTPAHTPTHTPTSTPTATLTETPAPCAIATAPEFEPRLNAKPDILLALGCPTGERQQTWAAEERFQHGRMFWQQDTDMIHILYDDTGTFQMEPDQYVEGDPEDACPEVGDAPAGLFKPVRGFNWQWCNTTGVQDALGWALEGENGYDAVWQEFEHGHVLTSRANHIFVFYEDGTWDYIE